MKKLLLTLTIIGMSVHFASAQSLLHRTSEDRAAKKVDNQIAVLTNQLQLNDDQQERISKEFEKYYERKNEIIQSDLSSREKRKEIKSSLEESLSNIESYLTDAQSDRYNDIKRNKMREMRKRVRNAPRRQ
ncbi:hypothetical protein [Haloflavibacter putidus]|uniref:LTXXQ motif family protein n=1 Tax=Haloflavibacter putidus TaxID=2576776 RepID=A0A507ZQT3_9FLAO|nr:hypothetical protein [Haloflavibacter putidus]TQD40136.1 hypothetical protein FKR84_02765 [Haloflavibacter putidus]